MSLTELFLIAVGLSMDACAVAIGIGLTMEKVTLKKSLIVGIYFGFFQLLMPLIGYLAGTSLADSITAYDHWIAFVLLSIIGGKMIKESFEKEKPPQNENSAQKDIEKNNESALTAKKMLPLAVATSIDALAAGVGFAFLKVDIIPAVSFIGIVTLGLSMLGVKVGNLFGIRFKSKAELTGGIILIIMGLKILLEHMGILNLY